MCPKHTPQPPSAEELDAIRAELEALGEDPSNLEGLHSDPNDVDLLEQPAFSLLLASSPQAQLDDLRARRLLHSVHDALPHHTPEFGKIRTELEALGEDTLTPHELHAHKSAGEHAQNVLDAVHTNTLEALSNTHEPPLETLPTLHLVRALHPHATLSTQRSSHLRDTLQVTRHDNIIPWPKRLARPLFALASLAAALVAVFAFSLSGDKEASVESPVAQIELDNANNHLKHIEKVSLQSLLSRQGQRSLSGDHTLRDLRFARQKARQARIQARGRRL